MLRFILEKKFNHGSGCTGHKLFSIDGDLKALETALRSGGFGEDQYSITQLLGVEILDEKEAPHA